jgi:guanine deaminase
VKELALVTMLNDPTSHGEIAAIRAACKTLQTSSLPDTVLYTSMQPCLMCMAAAMWSSIPKIVFACAKDKVSADYYGGSYQIVEINKTLTRPMKLVHLSELEQESLTVVHRWESTI